MIQLFFERLTDLYSLTLDGSGGELIVSVLKWALAAGVVLLLAGVLSYRWARLKHDLAMVALIALPLAILSPLSLPVTVGHLDPGTPEFQAKDRTFGPAWSAFRPETSGVWRSFSTRPRGYANPWGNGLADLGMFVWLLGALVMAAEAGLQWLGLRGLLRSVRLPGPELESKYAHLVAEHDLQLFVSAHAAGPFVTGLKPKIIIPDDDEDHALTLRHEIAHVEARDVLTGWVTALCKILFWPIPLVWIASKISEESREVACDAYAVKEGGRAEYGRLLVKYALAPVPVGTSFAKSGKSLFSRIQELNRNRNRHDSNYRRLPVALGVLLLIVGASAVETRPAVEPLSLVFRNDTTPAQMVGVLGSAALADVDVLTSGLEPVRVWVVDNQEKAGEKLKRLSVLVEGEVLAADDPLGLSCMKGLTTGATPWVLELPVSLSKYQARLHAENAGFDVCMVTKDPNWIRISVPYGEGDAVADLLSKDENVVATDRVRWVGGEWGPRSPRSDLKVIEVDTLRVRVPAEWSVTAPGPRSVVMETPDQKVEIILVVRGAEDLGSAILPAGIQHPNGRLVDVAQTILVPEWEFGPVLQRKTPERGNPARKIWEEKGRGNVAITAVHEGQLIELRASGEAGYVSSILFDLEMLFGDATRFWIPR